MCVGKPEQDRGAFGHQFAGRECEGRNLAQGIDARQPVRLLLSFPGGVFLDAVGHADEAQNGLDRNRS
ncbi:hypothetical protein D3C80_2015100 [compost metagenome]